jgi:quinol monooxygenase YgiN
MPAQMLEADNFVSHREQMQIEVEGPIVLMNKFSVADPDEVDAFIKTWAESAQYMKQQPGFLWSQFHRGIGSNTFLNYAGWESLETLRVADRSPGFREILSRMPDSLSAMPYAFQKVTVPNVCVGP